MDADAQSWKRLHEDGAEWEARVVAGGGAANPDATGDDILEFVCLDGTRKPRRVALEGPVTEMGEAELRRAYRRARPIGGDHYGRPGKPMQDAG